MSDNPLIVVNNPVPQEIVVAKKVSALSRLFTLKPASMELVSKATRQEGAEPGTFRVISTNEKFKEVRAVILFEPIEQREMYRKGEYSKDAKLCFSLDNVQPHARAANPPAMYCAACPLGDSNWEKWREGKAKGKKGEELTALLPPCRKYWHLFIADRATQMPYYLNVKGTSVKPFEDAMQNVARLFQMILANLKAELKSGKDVKLPETIGEIIWKISFTIYPELRNGTWQMGFKDFKVMAPEDAAAFGKILADIEARRQSGQVQSQEASEAEAEAAVVTEAPATKSIPVADAEVIQQNSQIQI
jgi:hypothetical protein